MMDGYQSVVPGSGLLGAPRIITPFAKLWIDRWCNQYAEVDIEDHAYLAQWVWSLHHDQRGHAYVRRRAGSTRRRTERTIYLHRTVMLRVAPPPSPAHLYVDHINNCGLDNRRMNLRWVTASENAKNVAHYGGMQVWFIRRQAERATMAFVPDEPIPF